MVLYGWLGITDSYSLRTWTISNPSLAGRPSHISSYGYSYLSLLPSTVSIRSLQSICWLSPAGPAKLNPQFPSMSPAGSSPPVSLLRSFFWATDGYMPSVPSARVVLLAAFWIRWPCAFRVFASAGGVVDTGDSLCLLN